MSEYGKRGTILVIGGGISGITAAIEASEAGADVVLLEKEAFLGGRVARSNQYFPKLCPPTCGLEINVRRIKTSPNIRCLTTTEVESIAGEPGNYQVTIRRNPRFVNAKCTACAACVDVCPEERPDAFNLGKGTTKAIYLPFEMAYPLRYVVDEAACLGEEECGKCVEACPYDAIDLGMEAETEELEVQAIIMATGWDPPDATRFEGLGYGTHENVLTNVEMERLAAPNGPTGGRIQKGDGGDVQSVAFVQCAGSRDENYYAHCSGVCCMASLKQARYVRAQYPDADIYVFYIDIRAPGRLEDFYAASQEDEKLNLIKGKVAKVTANGGGTLEVEAEDTLSGDRVTQAVDLVVLATGMIPTASGIEMENGLQTDEHGFLTASQPQAGLLPIGCAKRPIDVAACVRDATGAAVKALQFCAE